MAFTFQDIISLAPEKESQKKIEALASIRKWRNLKMNKEIVWGEVKSGGAAYFKCFIEPRSKYYKCNCPNRKKACQHVLALISLHLQSNDFFKIEETLPEWVEKALNSKVEGKEDSDDRKRLADIKLAEQRLKTREKRLNQMDEGMRELSFWLSDILRQGLAILETQSDEFWQDISSRMVNAKCGSLAKRITNWKNLIGQEKWHEKLFIEIGEIYLLLRGFKNLDKLPSELQHELLNQAGLNFKKENLLELRGDEDTWMVIGQTEGTDDQQLFYRRTWLAGEKTRQLALILDFAWGTNPYEGDWKPGQQFRGEIVFYPSSSPMRALIKKHHMVQEPFLFFGSGNLDSFVNEYAIVRGKNPWINLFPAFLENVIPIYEGENFFLLDENKKMLKLKKEEERNWKMIAISGGHPISIFGQWDGEELEPLSAIIEDRFILLREDKPLARPSRNWNRW